ncbi:MAG: hypothetical protein ACE5KF_01640 [Kiloniellaceae bacterium]
MPASLPSKDVERALNLAPDHPDGRLERGILRRLAGDDLGARDDRLKLIEIADGSPAAEAARANLEKLGVRADCRPKRQKVKNSLL